MPAKPISSLSPEEHAALLVYRRALRQKHRVRLNAERRAERAADSEKFRQERRESYHRHRDRMCRERRQRWSTDADLREKSNAARSAHYASNKADHLAYARRRYHADPAKAREEKCRYYAQNKDAVKAGQLRYRQSEAGKVAMQRAHDKEYTSNYEAFIERNNKRRAMQASAAVGTDRKAYRDLIRFARSAPAIPCHWCGAETAKGARHIDHIMPLNRQGKDCVSNLCVTCPTCNLSKGQKTPDEFRLYLRIANPAHPFAA